MKEIKFNAVDEAACDYVRFDDFISELKKDNAFGYIEYRDDDTHNELLAKFLEYYYGYKLLLYTGLKDQNGTEIYEGDILKVKLSNSNYFDDNTGKVYFRNGCFTIMSIDIFNNTFIYFPKSRCIEVIGNIYENNKLLNEKEHLSKYSYYILVSNLWQKTNKDAYDNANHNNGLTTIRINNEYFDEVFEVIHDTSMCLEDRIKLANEMQEEE